MYYFNAVTHFKDCLWRVEWSRNISTGVLIIKSLVVYFQQNSCHKSWSVWRRILGMAVPYKTTLVESYWYECVHVCVAYCCLKVVIVCKNPTGWKSDSLMFSLRIFFYLFFKCEKCNNILFIHYYKLLFHCFVLWMCVIMCCSHPVTFT